MDELQTEQKGGLNLDGLIVVPNVDEEEVSVQAVSTNTELPVESAAPFTPPLSSRSVGGCPDSSPLPPFARLQPAAATKHQPVPDTSPLPPFARSLLTPPTAASKVPAQHPLVKQDPARHTIFPVRTPDLGPLNSILQSLRRDTVSLPMCHMEYVENLDGTYSWKEQEPVCAPPLSVCLQVHNQLYDTLCLDRPVLRGRGSTVVQCVPDTRAEPDMCSTKVAKNLGLDIDNLIPI